MSKSMRNAIMFACAMLVSFLALRAIIWSNSFGAITLFVLLASFEWFWYMYNKDT